MPKYPSRRLKHSQRISAGDLIRPLADSVQTFLAGRITSPGIVHHTRVAIRRLRVAMAALELESPRPLSRRLKRIQDALGSVREWDAISTSREPTEQLHGHRDKETLRAVDRQRKKASRSLGRVLGKRAKRVIRGLDELISIADSAPAVDREAAVKALQARYVHMRVVLESLTPDFGEEDLHHLRIQVKKLRYTAELYTPLFPAATVRRCLNQLEHVQTELGSRHDLLREAVLMKKVWKKARRRGRHSSPPGQPTPDAGALVRTLRDFRPFWPL